MFAYSHTTPTPSVNLTELFKQLDSKLKEKEAQAQASKVENPVKPSHYASGMDPYAYALANNLGPLEMNVVKYVTRWKRKGGVVDIDKAIETLQRLKAHAQGGGKA